MKLNVANLLVVLAFVAVVPISAWTYKWVYPQSNSETSKTGLGSETQATEEIDQTENSALEEVVDVAEHFRGFSGAGIIRGIVSYAKEYARDEVIERLPEGEAQKEQNE